MPETDTGIVYEQSGAGTPVVFIHGWLGNKESWTPVRDRLAGEYRAVWYDQRCHGASACEPFQVMRTLERDLDAVITEAGLENPVLAGHSMGGMVALSYAVRQPVAGLFLAGTCASTPQPIVKSPKFFLEQYEEIDRERWADMIVENYTWAGTPDEIVAEAKQQLLAADPIPVRSGLRAMIDFDVRDQLPDVPAAVLGGKHDNAITPEKMWELAALLGTSPVMLDAGHDIIHEAPDQVAAHLDQFLSA